MSVGHLRKDSIALLVVDLAGEMLGCSPHLFLPVHVRYPKDVIALLVVAFAEMPRYSAGESILLVSVGAPSKNSIALLVVDLVGSMLACPPLLFLLMAVECPANVYAFVAAAVGQASRRLEG